MRRRLDLEAARYGPIDQYRLILRSCSVSVLFRESADLEFLRMQERERGYSPRQTEEMQEAVYDEQLERIVRQRAARRDRYLRTGK